MAVAVVLGLWMPAFAGPKIYIAKGACPFEYCTYRQWSVLAGTVLFNQPQGTQPVAKISKGQWVTAITGEVHLVPAPMKVVFEHGRFHVGDQAYLLTNEGEGVMKVWLNGVISEEDVWFVGDPKWQDWGNAGGRRSTCAHPRKECWGTDRKVARVRPVDTDQDAGWQPRLDEGGRTVWEYARVRATSLADSSLVVPIQPGVLVVRELAGYLRELRCIAA